ncbi:hypothetical protein AMAG_11464 [Allomyces macrogynus ATCC 38327]|uniref:Alanyl-transfer RNA synthetases family profile domain-containing protein n=1 Tax=Allomyces macrogynus (strain ATCC 38327) TaxID=578462 RepID=A0A0L0SWT2_ALLM3|nr:hypothetical protein AMAG_11464 [Allomyces macrogynus ATCC 38327]|eukprot:KNE66998.1 hypothetical protein AMAG_11464 [Allomyces macrogynus ATCC 38327]
MTTKLVQVPATTTPPTLGTPVGDLLCQRDSFARTLRTKVLAVTRPAPASVAAKNGGKKDKGKPAVVEQQEPVLHVVLEDTVLFPEGGGQPADRGSLTLKNGKQVPVIDVQRQGLTAVHMVPAAEADGALAVGDEVEATVDWARRWDAMQQHSGQHLLSALAETVYGWRTASWALGTDSVWNSVEFAPDLAHSQPVTLDRLDVLEDMVADHIAADLTVTVHDGASSAAPDRTRGIAKTLPQDLQELGHDAFTMRTVVIGATPRVPTASSLPAVETEKPVDVSLCCGTSVASTAQLQTVAIKPSIAKIRGTNSRVFFAFGERVRTQLTQPGLKRDAALGALVSGAPTELVDKVSGVMETAKADRRLVNTLTNELTAELAKRLLPAAAAAAVKTGATAGFVHYHRATTSLDFLVTLANTFKNLDPAPANPVRFVLTGADDKVGLMVVVGPAEDVPHVGDAIRAAVPDVKGGGGKGKPGTIVLWQGRCATGGAALVAGVRTLGLPNVE